MSIQDTEEILRKLFPDEDEEWIKLSTIMHKEKAFLEERRAQYKEKSRPLEFEQRHLSELQVDESELRRQILEKVDEIITNKRTGQDFIEKVENEIQNFTKIQLQKTLEILLMLAKFVEVKQAETKAEPAQTKK